MTDQAATFQLTLAAAEAYEAQFVPALFAEWAPHLVEDSRIVPGQRVLDVACGTGIVARTVADRIGPDAVVGIDLNPAMLMIARRVRPAISWHDADVGALPFDDASFDVVLCQFALMFFPDRSRALSEMFRVTAPGGVVAVSVPASLGAQSAYRLLVELASREAGPDAVTLLGTYWNCGDLDYLHELIQSPGLDLESSRTFTSTAHYPSIEAFVDTEVGSTPLAEQLKPGAIHHIRAEAEKALADYVTTEGTLNVPLTGHVVVSRRPVDLA